MGLLRLPMDKDKSFEVYWTLMLGHPHQRIILPPSVGAKRPNGKTIGAERSHDEDVELFRGVRLASDTCRRIRFFRYSSRGASFLFRRESCRLSQPTGKRYQRASREASLARTAVADPHVFIFGSIFHRSQSNKQNTKHGRKWGEGYKLYVASKADEGRSER